MKKKKTKSVPVYTGTKTLGVVVREYVQINVPDSHIDATVDALTQALLSDFYRKYWMTEHE